jgi:hypothetical protein
MGKSSLNRETKLNEIDAGKENVCVPGASDSFPCHESLRMDEVVDSGFRRKPTST